MHDRITLSGKCFKLRGVSYLFSVIRQGQTDRQNRMYSTEFTESNVITARLLTLGRPTET